MRYQAGKLTLIPDRKGYECIYRVLFVELKYSGALLNTLCVGNNLYNICPTLYRALVNFAKPFVTFGCVKVMVREDNREPSFMSSSYDLIPVIFRRVIIQVYISFTCRLFCTGAQNCPQQAFFTLFIRDLIGSAGCNKIFF